MNNYVITISRMFGSGGRVIGKMLSERLGIGYYDKDLIKLVSEDSGISEGLFGMNDEKTKPSIFPKSKIYTGNVLSPSDKGFTSDKNLFELQAKIIERLADEKAPCIIIGRCADYILSEREHILRVFIWASHDECIKNTMEICGYDGEKAEKEVDRINKERDRYYKSHTGNDRTDARNYDLCLDTEKFTFEECCEIIEKFIMYI